MQGEKDLKQNKMPEHFKDKDGNPLEKGVLYDLSPLSWPLSFQGYENHQEGDSTKPEAVFWDFKGYPHYFNRKRVEIIAVKTTSEKAREYTTSAKSLVEWLSIKETQIAQSQTKCTEKTFRECADENSCLG